MRAFALVCAAALCLQACAHVTTPALPAGARYVNMGSSFAAGSGSGLSPAGATARCHQSTVNYARLLAARLQLSLSDVSCGGATSAHILNAWNELPPQIDAVTSETRLVTITVGGNDLAYAGNLIAASCEPAETIRTQGIAATCPPQPYPVAEEAYAKLEQNLREIARQIAVRAPQAKTIFIQYITLVPQTQCANSRFTEEEATRMRAVGVRLAEITARAAQENGATVLAMDALSKHHTPCDAEPWSVGLPANFDEPVSAPWHPNARGMEAIATALEGALRE